MYWERRPYEAIGPGAHAFDGATRRWNAPRLDGYIAALTPSDGSVPRLPPGGAERLDPETSSSEALILGLRTDRGVAADAAARPPFDDVATWAADAGLLEERDDRLVLTTKGRLLSNEVFARLV